MSESAARWPKPTWEPLPLKCGKCGATWDAWQPSGVPVATWTAHIRAQCCPSCGRHSGLLIRFDPAGGEAHSNGS